MNNESLKKLRTRRHFTDQENIDALRAEGSLSSSVSDDDARAELVRIVKEGFDAIINAPDMNAFARSKMRRATP